MFGINGKHLTRLDHGHNEVAAHNERFLVGKGNLLASGNKLIRCGKTGSAHYGDKNDIDVFMHTDVDCRLEPLYKEQASGRSHSDASSK